MISIFRKHRRIAGETAWIFAGQAVSALGTLAGFRMITEIVSPSDYGTVALALGAVGLTNG